MTKTGVEVNKGIAFNAIFLAITIINFLIVQVFKILLLAYGVDSFIYKWMWRRHWRGL